MPRDARRKLARQPKPHKRKATEQAPARRLDRLPGAAPAGAIAAAAVLLVALTLAAYLPALHAGFIWDDDSYVTANATLRSLDGLRRIWLEPGAVPQYYPLTFSSFW